MSYPRDQEKERTLEGWSTKISETRGDFLENRGYIDSRRLISSQRDTQKHVTGAYQQDGVPKKEDTDISSNKIRDNIWEVKRGAG